jgi:hypothetical protein
MQPRSSHDLPYRRLQSHPAHGFIASIVADTSCLEITSADDTTPGEQHEEVGQQPDFPACATLPYLIRTAWRILSFFIGSIACLLPV